MKHFFTSILVLSMAACSAASTTITYQALLVLPNGRFMVGGLTTDLASAMAHLGPPDTTQVNITVCPKTEFVAVKKVEERLEAAGYNRIGFASVEASDSALCSNNSFKADGSAAA